MDAPIRRRCLLSHVLTEVPCTLELIGRNPILGVRQPNIIGVSVLKLHLAETKLLTIFLRRILIHPRFAWLNRKLLRELVIPRGW